MIKEPSMTQNLILSRILYVLYKWHYGNIQFFFLGGGGNKIWNILYVLPV
jgi:hypothetical protein